MDLQVCLDRTNERLTLAQKLRDANMKRLLHPGADTKDIIDQYISTIRCLRMVDPSGVGAVVPSANLKCFIACGFAGTSVEGGASDKNVPEVCPLSSEHQAQSI